MFTLLFENASQMLGIIGSVFSFVLTFILLSALKDKLPTDIGRAFAVNAGAAKGKPRGAGIIFVIVFIGAALLFAPLKLEYGIYYVLMVLSMLSGYLDDASRNPWSEYKKGLIDLLISVLIAVTYALYNGTEMALPLFGTSVALPLWLYIILGTVLVWASINVTNCTDGVDGLSSTLALISLGSFVVLFRVLPSAETGFTGIILFLFAAVLAYLWFNASPSILLMGDAGSRTIGVFFAIAAMKSGSPLSYLILCIVFIVDGGIGLIKVSLLRFLKIKILAHTRTPLHDHERKEKGWSDTHTVLRFAIIQLAVCALYLLAI